MSYWLHVWIPHEIHTGISHFHVYDIRQMPNFFAIGVLTNCSGNFRKNFEVLFFWRSYNPKCVHVGGAFTNDGCTHAAEFRWSSAVNCKSSSAQQFLVSENTIAWSTAHCQRLVWPHASICCCAVLALWQLECMGCCATALLRRRTAAALISTQ